MPKKGVVKAAEERELERKVLRAVGVGGREKLKEKHLPLLEKLTKRQLGGGITPSTLQGVKHRLRMQVLENKVRGRGGPPLSSTKMILQHIKAAAGVEELSSRTIGKIREHTEGMAGWQLQEEIRATGALRSTVSGVLKVLREDPSPNVKRTLHALYTAELPTTLEKLEKKAGYIDAPTVVVLAESGLIQRTPKKVKLPEYGITSPRLIITWRDKEEMKKIWGGIEGWKGERKARFEEGVWLSERELLKKLGLKSTGELRKEHLSKIARLGEEMKPPPGNIRALRNKLRMIARENTAFEEREKARKKARK